MSIWLRLPLILVSVFIAARFGYFTVQKRSWILGTYGLSLVFFGIHQSARLTLSAGNFPNYVIRVMDQVSGWGGIIAIALVFCGLIHLIRVSKPLVVRFPFFFTLLPLLIIATYPFAYDAEVIDNWLFQIYEGGAILVGLIMYSLQFIKNRKPYYVKVLIGILLIIVSYVSYWFLGHIQEVQSWMWPVAMIAGLISFYVGYRDAIME